MQVQREENSGYIWSLIYGHFSLITIHESMLHTWTEVWNFWHDLKSSIKNNCCLIVLWVCKIQKNPRNFLEQSPKYLSAQTNMVCMTCRFWFHLLLNSYFILEYFICTTKRYSIRYSSTNWWTAAISTEKIVQANVLKVPPYGLFGLRWFEGGWRGFNPLLFNFV